MPPPATEKLAKTRIWLISDIHGESPKPDTIFQLPLPKCDVLIIAGDLSKHGELVEYEKILLWIKACDAELKIVIAGNHDITLDQNGSNEPWLFEAAKDLWTNHQAKAAGIRFLGEETRTFTLKSGVRFTVHTSPYQPIFHTKSFRWAFGYDADDEGDRWNPKPSCPTETDVPGVKPIPDGIDILVTHGPPNGINDTVEYGVSVGCKLLRQRLEVVRPILHVFGHIHEDFGVTRVQWGENGEARIIPLCGPNTTDLLEKATNTGANAAWELDMSRDGKSPLRVKGKETLCVNASLMDKETRDVQCGGVLIDIDLPVLEKF